MVLTKLPEILKNREMSDEQLAVKTMLTVRSIQNAKKGRGVSLNTSKRIAKGLKLTLDQLV
jgi:transcriptional regulator with XRE-family HTH domain